MLLLAALLWGPEAGAGPGGAGKMVMLVDASHSKLHYEVKSTLHTVHGEFTFERGRIEYDPASGQAGGEIVVDAGSGNSGNASRDKRMNKEVLESGRYKEAEFHPVRIEGKLEREGKSQIQVEGTLRLHGAEHEMKAPMEAEIAGGQWKATGSFEVPYIAWGMRDPGNFLLKVSPQVEIEVEMKGSVETGKQ